MKHFRLILLACMSFIFMGITNLSAQDNKGKRLQFVYIDHEVTTPIDVLNQRMTQRFYDIVEYPDQDAMVVYLSNGRRSPVALVNLQEYLHESQLQRTAFGQARDTQDAFKGVIEMMNKANSYTVDARIDMDNILELLDGLQVFDEDGHLNFKALRFDFYVGPNFWLLGNNEKLIAHLFMVLRQGIHDEDKEKLSFNVFKPNNTQLEYKDGKLFGNANIDGINNSITIMDY